MIPTKLIKTINNSVGTRSYNPFKIPVYLGLPTLFLTEQEGEMEQNFGTIYIATNLINRKQNVGQTTRTFKKRQKEHHGKNDTLLLYRAIKKYGAENFKWISFTCPEEDLDWTETFLIAELNTQVPNGYNLESGGHKNKHHHELTRKKMSENHWDNSGENHPMWGKHPSEKTRQKISESNSGENHPMWGKHHIEESRQKMSESQLGEKSHMWGKTGKNHPKWGTHPTEESRQKMSESKSGENNPKARAVILISPEGIKHQLLSCRHFCKEHNLDDSHICKVLQGKQKQHKGWTGYYKINK